MIRLLHLSDIHLNTGFANKTKAVRELLKEGLIQSFVNAVDYTLSENLEGIIIAGDFMDNDKISFKLEHRIIEQFQRLINAQRHIFYASGNHDPMNTSKFLSHFETSLYFHYFENDDIKRVEILCSDNENFEVVGCGHKSKNEKRNLIKQYPRKSNKNIWIGIGHASVPSAFSVGEKEQYMATTKEDIELLNYDYFALGHIHIQQLLTERIGYCGNIQGLNYKEIGEKGGYLLEFNAAHLQITPVAFNEIQWEAFDFELDETMETLQNLEYELIQFVTSEIEDIQKSANQLILRINLEGRTPLVHALREDDNIEYLEEMIKAKVGLLSVNIKRMSISSTVNKNEILSEKTVLSEALELLEKFERHEELLSRLLELPIYGPNMTQNEKMTCLKKYMESVDDELIDRFIRG